MSHDAPMSHDELDDYEAAKAAARAAYDDDETAAITARDEERGSAYDDDDDDDDDDAGETAAMTAQEAPPKAELGSVAALVLIALSAFGFSAQALIVKFLTRSDPVPPMEIVFFRGCFQFAGCCGLLGLYPPMCRSPSRWFGDSCVEMRWLGLRGLVGFGGIAFSFQAVSLLGIAEVQVVQFSVEIKYTVRSSWIAASTSTPSTRHLLDSVAVSVPHRSTEPARPCRRREMT